jgi:hypothetical protein
MRLHDVIALEKGIFAVLAVRNSNLAHLDFCIAVLLLCWQLQRDVEKALMDLHIGLPTSRMRTAGMIAEEPAKPTARMPRDRSVLNRYRNYLRQWVRLWSAGVTRHRRMSRKC